ncbi:MAG: hypothetical protein FWC51_00690 [Proteobacteria bacterium]|nr:hypothetical protein [Pseudomonadota bacterium]
MIDYTNTLNELLGKIDINAVAAADASELVAAADRAVGIGARAVLVTAASAHTIWAWLENKDILILSMHRMDKIKEQRAKPAARNSLGEGRGQGQRYENLILGITSVLKKGADGAVIDAGADLSGLASVLFSVRADLFFGKKLMVAVDLARTDPLSWGDVFLDLKKIDADGLFLTFGGDSEKRDLAGRLYGMLNAWDAGFNGVVYFDLDRPRDIEEAHRLVGKMRPELKNRVRFFIKQK